MIMSLSVSDRGDHANLSIEASIAAHSQYDGLPLTPAYVIGDTVARSTIFVIQVDTCVR